jgi:aromatic-L-amino-acid decarboxylase
MFEEFVKNDSRFEIMASRTVTLVCFRLKHEKAEEINKQLLHDLNETGKIYLVHTVLHGQYTIRFAVGGTLQQERHVIEAWNMIQQAAEKLLQ